MKRRGGHGGNPKISHKPFPYTHTSARKAGTCMAHWRSLMRRMIHTWVYFVRRRMHTCMALHKTHVSMLCASVHRFIRGCAGGGVGRSVGEIRTAGRCKVSIRCLDFPPRLSLSSLSLSFAFTESPTRPREGDGLCTWGGGGGGKRPLSNFVDLMRHVTPSNYPDRVCVYMRARAAPPP